MMFYNGSEILQKELDFFFNYIVTMPARFNYFFGYCYVLLVSAENTEMSPEKIIDQCEIFHSVQKTRHTIPDRHQISV